MRGGLIQRWPASGFSFIVRRSLNDCLKIVYLFLTLFRVGFLRVAWFGEGGGEAESARDL